MLTWMWMEMTLWNMGNHSILGAKWGKATVIKVAGASKMYILLEPVTFRGAEVFLSIQSPVSYCNLGSIVLDHHARYTEADVIPCTGEEPGEAKEREALRGAVLKQVWARRGQLVWRAPRRPGSAVLQASLSSFSFLSSSGGPPSTRITPEFSKWASDGKS